MPISSYSIAEIREHFEALVKRPRLLFFDVFGDDGLEVEKWGAKIKVPFKFSQEATRSKLAAWYWLCPKEPRYTLAQITSIQKSCRLSESLPQVISNLHDACLHLQRAHPELGLWFRQRAALLKCHEPPPPIPDAETEAQVLLRYSQLEAYSLLLGARPEKALEVAKRLCRDALKLAAFSVCTLFKTGKAECPVSANLMVPLHQKPDLELISHVENSDVATKNHDKAVELWNHAATTDAREYLLIAAETKHAEHVGFWIPVARGDGNRSLPGGPHAYATMQGCSVFKDDLPVCEGFPGVVERRWRSYMEESFTDRLFISLPFCVRDGHELRPIAVVNINANPPVDDTGWHRAYHQEWLRDAVRRVAPCAEIALRAAQIGIAATAPAVLSAVRDGKNGWEILPGIQSKRLLEAPSSDTE